MKARFYLHLQQVLNFSLSLFFLFFSLVGFSQTQWNADVIGGTSSWNNPTNWTNGVPSAGVATTIFSCTTCPTISSTDQESGYLQIFNGGKLTIETGGHLTIENPGNSALKIWDNANLNINTDAELSIQNFYGEGISIYGSLENSGSLEIDGGHTGIYTLESGNISNHSSGEIDITGDFLNYGIFTNSDISNDGNIIITKAIQAGLFQQNGTITNNHEITIKDTGVNGIFQKNKIINAGQINIENALTGLYSLSADFENTENGYLNISGSNSLNKGIFANHGVFSNHGLININDAQNTAINTSNTLTFDNYGEITIEYNELYGVLNTGNSNFINHPCAQIYSSDKIVNWANFTNNGLLIVETSEASNIGVNNGIVYSLDGGTVSVASGNIPLTNRNRHAWLGCKNKIWANGENWAFGNVPMFFPPNHKEEAVIPDVSMTTGNSPEVSNLVPSIAGVTMLENSHLTITNSGRLECIFDTPPEGFFKMYPNTTLVIAFSGELRAHEIKLDGDIINGGKIQITQIINGGGNLQNRGTLENFGTIKGGLAGINGSFVTNFGTLVNEGIIDIPVALNGGLNNLGQFNNNNIIKIMGGLGTSGSLANMQGGIFQNSEEIILTGWIRNSTISTFSNSGNISIYNNYGTAILVNGSSNFNNSGGISITNGRVSHENGTFDNSGDLSIYSSTAGSGILNQDDFSNSGNILIESASQIGIINNLDAFFNNTTTGIITVNNPSLTGIDNFGTFTNSGTMEIEAGTETPIFISPSGQFHNQASGNIYCTKGGNGFYVYGLLENSGNINIENATDNGMFIEEIGTFLNYTGGNITMKNFGEIGIQLEGLLTNTGYLKIENFSSRGILVTPEGKIENNTNGQIDLINATGNPNVVGLWIKSTRFNANTGSINISGIDGTCFANEGHFYNRIVGTISMNSSHDPIGLVNLVKMENRGNIFIQNMSSGFENYDLFTNFPSGNIEINAPSYAGIINFNHIDNSGNILIEDGENWGMINSTSHPFGFRNFTGSSLTINNLETSSDGLLNSGAFFNSGIVDIQNAGGDAIFLGYGFFNNHPCAEVIVHDSFNSEYTFRNEGIFRTDFSGTNINSGTFINTGIVEDFNNSFDGVVIDNEQIIVQPISGLFGEPIYDALDVGTIPPGYSIGSTWYSDAGLTTSAGSYLGFPGGTYENVFNPSISLGVGTHTLYFEIGDDLHPEICTKIVAIKVVIISPTVVLLSSNNIEEEITFGNYPNPFDNETEVVFTLLRDAKAKVVVYDMKGTEVEVLYEGEVKGEKQNKFTFDASDLPAGFYVAKIFSTNGRTTPIKMIKVED